MFQIKPTIKLASFLLFFIVSFLILAFPPATLATCYCVNPGPDQCKCSGSPPAGATFSGNQDGVAVMCTSQAEADSTFVRKNPICGSKTEIIPYCAFKKGDPSEVTCYGTEFTSASRNIPSETNGLIEWHNQPVDFNGFHADNVNRLLTCAHNNFCCTRSDIQCDDSNVPALPDSCSPQDGPGNTKVCSPTNPPPNPGMACDQTTDPEFHSLRPYRGAFCNSSAPAIVNCGNDFILQKNYQLTPSGGKCTTNPDKSIHCDYVIDGSSDINVSVPNGQLPIAGNTQLVPNSANASPSPSLTDAQKTNEYVSWFLNGILFRAENVPLDAKNLADQETIADYAGPLRKLLPQSIIYQAQIKQIQDKKTVRHDQVVVCANKITGNPHPCYGAGFINNLLDDSDRLSYWDGELSPFNTILGAVVNIFTSILPNYSADQIKLAIGKPWNKKIPPLEGGLDMDDKPFTDVSYRKAYQEWRGKTCAIFNVPLINIRQLICVDNPLVWNRFSNLFPYIPLSSTEDLPGKIGISGSGGGAGQAAPMFPGADKSACGGGPIGDGVPISGGSVNLADYIAGAGFIEHDLSTGEHVRFTGEGGSGPGSPVRMYKNGNYEQFFVGSGVYRREDTSWAPLSGFQDATCTGGGKAVLTTDPGCNQYSEGQGVTNDGALWAPPSASVGSSWNSASSQLVTVAASSLPSRKYCSLTNLSGYDYPNACNQSSSFTLSAYYPAGSFNFCTKVKNLTDMIVIETTGGPGTGDTFYYMKNYGLVGFEVSGGQTTAQTAGVSNVSFKATNSENLLYVPHMEENTQLSSLLQSTYAAKGANTAAGGGSTASQTQPHCEIVNTRTNPGDDLLGGKSTPVKGTLKFTFATSCDFGPPQLDTVNFEECVKGGTPATVCQIKWTTTSACSRQAQVALSVYTKFPKVNELWNRTVVGTMSIFKRIFPQDLSNKSQLLDIPGVTNANYQSLGSGDKVLAGDPGNNRPGSAAQIFIPHIGSVYEYFLKGIQTALRPKDIGSTIISGVQTPPKELNCDTNAPDPGSVPGLLSRDRLVAEFANEFKGNHIEDCYNDVVYKSLAAGYNPGFVMAIWIEESGASDYAAFPNVSDFGCAVNTPKSDFNAQIGCFLGLKASYANGNLFKGCRAGGGTAMDNFLLIFSEGATHACNPTDACYLKYCLNGAFPGRIKSYYQRVSGNSSLPTSP